VDDNKFGVPAGWYPDPLGLPQLRWWDAQAWTEHTSEARAPIVVQPATRLAYADDDDEEAPVAQDYEDLPASRREQRERERRATGVSDYSSMLTESDAELGELSAQPLLAMTLRELEPPLTDTLDDFTPGPRRASAHANAAQTESTLSAMAEELTPERQPKRMKTFTFAVWLIALLPVLQTAMMVVLILSGLGSNLPLIITVIGFPFVLVVGLAFYDRLELMTWGHAKQASPAWALLQQPAYLLARSVRTIKETGRGFAPFTVWFSSLGLVLAACLVFPGLAIAPLSGQFRAQMEASVGADGKALGASLTVMCSDPPLIIGESTKCRIISADRGSMEQISVTLERANGWISWRVDKWPSWLL